MRMRSRSGFSLIEILIAIVVLAIGIMGVLGALTYGLKAGEYSSRTTQATNLSRRLLERVLVDQAWNGNALKGSEGKFDPNDQATWTAVDASPYSGMFADAGDRTLYYRQIQFFHLGDADPDGEVIDDKINSASTWENDTLARVKVTVTYFDKNGIPKSVSTWAYCRR